MANVIDLTQIANIILQIDGTTLAGVLILLTIRSFVSENDPRRSRFQIQPNWVVGLVGTPFAFSALIVVFQLLGLLSPNPLDPADVADFEKYNAQLLQAASVFTVIGFLYMIWVFFKINSRVIKKPKEIKKTKLDIRIERFFAKRKRDKRKKEIQKRYEEIFNLKTKSRFSFSNIRSRLHG